MSNWRTSAYLRYLAKSSKPILIGPWRSEVGFESLYWLPWLTAWRTQYQIPKERLIAISRGGAGVWYDAHQHVDLYDYAPLDRVRKAMLKDSAEKGSIKQQGISPWEASLLPLIANDLGLRRYHVLHPSLMYQGLADWWGGTMSQLACLKQLAFAPMPTGFAPLALPLPERFVAVRFYARHTWPLQEELKAFVHQLVDHLAKHIPVVLLQTGLPTDDHHDFPIDGPNIQSIQGFVTARDNLQIQSAVLAKAVGFVGTYGGTMQLAVRLRKPSIGFFQTFEGTAYAHKALTEWLAVQQQTPCFIGRPDDARYVREVVGI